MSSTNIKLNEIKRKHIFYSLLMCVGLCCEIHILSTITISNKMSEILISLYYAALPDTVTIMVLIRANK